MGWDSALVRHEGRSGVGRGWGRGSALVRHEGGRGRARVGRGSALVRHGGQG